MLAVSKRKNQMVASLVIAAVICGAGSWYYLNYIKNGASGKVEDIVYEVKKGDIRSAITGTSQLEPKDMQLITGVDNSTVKTNKLTRNMDVKAGDLLVELTSPTLENQLQKAQVQLNQYAKDITDTQSQIASLQTKSPISGILTFAAGIDVGSTVSKTTKIATISDTRNLLITLPFSVADVTQLAVGDEVDLAFDNLLITKIGTIQLIGKDPRADKKGGSLVDVQISVTNDSTLDSTMKAKGSVSKGRRTIESLGTGTISYSKVSNVLANVSGTISQIVAKDGSFVNQGEILNLIINDTIRDDLASKQNTYDNQKLTIQDLQDRVEALKVKAPFDGVFSTDFVNKRTNVLTTLTPGAKVTGQTQFGGVADTKTMNLPIQVDELDLPNVKTGMKAVVRVDSLTGRSFDATVGQVSTVGTTTNGVTFFDVVLTVSNTNNLLKYGMTATGEILLQDKQNIIKIPTQALQTRGNKRFVTLKNADGTLKNDHEIKIGIRSKTEIEVTDGLKEGDIVVIPQLIQQQKLSQAEIDSLRQQFQGQGQSQGQGQLPGGGSLTPEQIQQLRDQFQGQNGGGNQRNGITGGNTGAGTGSGTGTGGNVQGGTTGTGNSTGGNNANSQRTTNNGANTGGGAARTGQ
jgi:HlyD family secretion protein